MINEDDKIGTMFRKTMDRARDAAIVGTGQTFGFKSPQAQRRLNINILSNQIMRNWLSYTEGQRYSGMPIEGNIEDLRNFIEDNFGIKALNYVEPLLIRLAQPNTPVQQTPQPTPQSNNQPTPARQQTPQQGTAPMGYAGSPQGQTQAVPQPTQNSAQQPSATATPQQTTSPAQTRYRFGPINARYSTFGKRQPPQTATSQINSQKETQLINNITTAMSKTRPGTPQRATIIDYIHRLQNNPNIVAKYPKLRDIGVSESVSYNRKLVEQKLNHSELDSVFKALANYHISLSRTPDRMDKNDSADIMPNRSRPNQGKRNNSRMPPSRGIETASNIMRHAITSDGFELALKKRAVVSLNLPMADINAIKDVLHRNSHSVSMENLIEDPKLQHISGKTFAAILFAVEMSR